MNSNQQAILVGQCQNARLLELVQNNRKLLHTSTLAICYLNDARIYFIKIEDFCQTVFPSTPWVILRSEKGISLIFPNA